MSSHAIEPFVHVARLLRHIGTTLAKAINELVPSYAHHGGANWHEPITIPNSDVKVVRIDGNGTFTYLPPVDFLEVTKTMLLFYADGADYYIKHVDSNVVNWLQAEGMLDDRFIPTKRGRRWVKSMLAVPLPSKSK